MLVQSNFAIQKRMHWCKVAGVNSEREPDDLSSLPHVHLEPQCPGNSSRTSSLVG